ncbi:MAG: invasion associated locus B family protein [Pseudomonadota bacterium]
MTTRSTTHFLSRAVGATTARFAGLALAASVALPVAVSGSAQAQTAAGERPPSQSWFKVCSKSGENDICNVQFNVTADTGQLVTAVNLLTVKGQINRRIFQVAVPTGRFLPAGVEVKIDEGKANKLTYSICLPNRCLAEVQLTDDLVNALKRGGKIRLTSVNFQNKKNPIDVTLQGFTAAYDGEPISQDKFKERQEKLQSELQKKAEEARRKLEEAQKAAKDQ